jgi:site-specific DNA recombinase
LGWCYARHEKRTNPYISTVCPAWFIWLVGVSTEEQVQEGYSIRAQEQKLKDFARVKDWSIYKIYADEGISGKNITARPAINEMLADIASGAVKNVVVFKIDRLTRSTADLIYLVDFFNNHDCAFNSLMESIDTLTASGRMFLKIVGIFAEFERENLVERVLLGIERKVHEGYSLCKNIVSYGYTRGIGEKIQVVCEEEAKIVREVFDMYINQGLSLRKIALKMNMLGVPTKTKKSKWEVKTVRNMLTNCNYIGNVRHHITKGVPQYEGEGVHEAIIPVELYEEAQKLILKNSNAGKTKRPKVNNYFSGLLVCSKCGETLCTHHVYDQLKDGTTSCKLRYRCPNRLLQQCDAYEFGKKQFEESFLAYIDDIADLDVGNEIPIQEQAQQENQKTAKNTLFEEKLRLLEAKRKEILSRYVDNEISFEDYDDMKKKLERDKLFIQQELENLRLPDPTDITIQKEDIIQELRENWHYLSEGERRQFLVKFVKKIVVINEKEEGQRHGKVKIIEIVFHES